MLFVIIQYRDIVQKYLSPELNAKATAAFRDNTRLAEMSLEERETAAQAYEQIAAITTGKVAELARLFNLERAKFLRGQITRIVHRARDFGDEIGYKP